MKVFISWSGEQSKALAEIFRQWLPSVIQSVKPYCSSHDIPMGSRWLIDIGNELNDTKIGLIILTRDNLAHPWINFEAGAISKSMDSSRVCPILFGIEPADIEFPLAQFQATKFKKDDFKKVIKSINDELKENSLKPEVLDSVFEKWWPELEQKINEEINKIKMPLALRKREDREVLEEILEISRTILQKSQNDSELAFMQNVSSHYSQTSMIADAIRRQLDMRGLLDKLDNINKPPNPDNDALS
jgi:hypothetical protein